ncbi:MAG: CCA tRNA nucleotidyltransferase [Candidatus Bathyarchaeota archaeon]|nr:CCA tRNA nucleotidyltransferase [Candidatus Bathyarchaeota archaeon]MDH5745714.1 CCA tRNA nucleotidyltransferase [Candidatus Bathyarchaeota archaeon]
MQERIEKVCTTVLERITPKKGERAKLEALAEKLEKKVVLVSKEFGVEAEVRVEGSVAKDTWLSREPDIDVFMRVPTTIPRKSLGDTCLRIARKATEGSKQIERFAEHPYLEAIVDNTRVNIVPCYKVKRGEWLSATDRTPFHTDYVKKRLEVQMRGEVRLLKKFMKGIGVYGAEIKVGGFSGYLCELLILHHKTFVNTLKAFAQHKKRTVIDIEGYYEGRENELGLLFKEPMVIIDPVDKGRNVASAVQPQKLYTFIAAARTFLKSPNKKFFYPPKTATSPAKELKQKLEKRGPVIIFLTFEKVDAVPDILWGQLYKSQRSLHKLVQLSGFDVLRDIPWSDEKTINMFIFELEQHFIPPVKKHLGPPLEKERECEKFLQKHMSSLNAVSGPHIEDGRWVVELRRKYTDVVALLNEKLKDGGRNAGVAEKISQVLRKGFRVFVNNEIVELYKKNSEFARFLTEFLSGKPKWLEAA